MMIADDCPLGRISCDGCNQLTTGGCSAKPRQQSCSSIKYNIAVKLWERRKKELMKLSKEELIELLIGKKEHIGMLFG